MDPTAALQHTDHSKKVSVLILHQLQRPLGITSITNKEQSTALAYISYLI